VYTDWFSQTEPRVKGARGAKYKGFATRAEAESFAIHGRVDTGNDPYGPSSSSSGHRQPLQPLSQSQRQSQVQVSNASLDRPLKTEKSPTPAKRSIGADGKLLDVDDASKFAKYYAVAIGRTIHLLHGSSRTSHEPSILGEAAARIFPSGHSCCKEYALGCAVRLHSVHGASQKTDKHSGFFTSSQARAWS
jgi:hypothetical protein